MLNRSIKIGLISLALCCLVLPAWAASEMEAGISAFNKHDYKTALGHFTSALRADPNDANALYYEAVTLHQLKELNLAKQAYATIILKYPGTDAARNAHAALSYLDPAFLKKFQQQVNSVASSNGSAPPRGGFSQESAREPASNLASLPDQVRVPYKKEGNNLVITAFINSHPIEMYFDSGAEATTVRKSQMQSLGLQDPRGAPIGMSYGVGDGGGQRTWVVKTDIKVGQIEHRDYPIAVQEDPAGAPPSYPLLGENFFRGFSYKVLPASDDGRGAILFQKKRANSSVANDSSSVSYKDMGTEMIVNVEVNGRTIPMIFDTGAETCCFTWHQWVDQLRMSVPDDAMDTHNSGIAGSTRSKHFTVESMRLGSVNKHDVPIDVIENSNIGYPLLGNSFFGDLHIEVDNAAHMIRLRK